MVATRIAPAHRQQIELPVLGKVTKPEPQCVAYYVVLVALGVLEIVEWPILGIVGIGHLLAGQHRFLILQEVGEAAEVA